MNARIARELGSGTIIVGVALRLRADVGDRPLGIDDARIALNVGRKTFWELTRVLDYNQAAPIPFLWAEKLATRVAGYSEFAVRALPLACGILLLPVLWLVGRRLLGEREAVLATLFAALSVLLIAYCTALKPYGIDAFVATCLLLLALRTLADPITERWRELAIGGAIAIVASFPAVFILAGIVAGLALDPRIRTDAHSKQRIFTTAGLWLVTFGFMYFWVYRSTSTDPYMRWFWETAFLTPGKPNFDHRVANAIREALVVPFYFYPDAAGPAREKVLEILMLVFCGLALQIRRSRMAPALLSVPYIAVTLAAIGGWYPASARLLLFLAPVLFLICAAGLVGLVDVAARGVTQLFHGPPVRVRGTAYGALVVAALAWRLPAALRYVRDVPPSGDIRRVIRAVEQAPDRDPAYVDGVAIPAWYFYTTDWRAPDRNRLAWIAQRAVAGGPAFENAPARDHPVRSGEGADLVDLYHGRREVVALAAGVGRRAVSWGDPPPADTGWAENEAWRLRQAADTAAWIVTTDTYHLRVTLGGLLAALRHYGGRVAWGSVSDGAVVYRVRFAPSRASH